MAELVTTSGGRDPESTDADSQKTGSSLAPAPQSASSDLGAAHPSSTRSETASSDPDAFLRVLGGVMGRGFTSTDQMSLWMYQLQALGYEREARLLAEGFTLNRSAGMQGFMG
jgi:hypothetical protein